jgi:hypothetical protein
MEVLDFEREYADFAEQVRNVANEIQYNVTAESEAINKYNNLKACIQHTTLGQRVTTLEGEMDTAQADITQLKRYYEVDLTTNSWSGSAGNYSYSIPAATHERGTRPRVHTYVNGEETYDSPKIDWTTGNVTVYSNAQVALKVLIY